MAQASRSVTINVPPEKLFEVIVDYEKYPEFLPEVKKVHVNAGQGSIKEVTYTVDIKAKVITYTLKHTAEKPAKVAWTMIKGEMMKGNDGAWTLKAGAQPGTTEATYTIDLKLSSLVPGFIEKALAEQSLPGLMANFKARAEKLHAAKV
ncbi:MAG: SRPBCC family protein [Deltaproteobacteria bacterium]|nr:MAG: SRPBCC family protein [Deltaproteobacteria bacterium]